jgi:hypothetical protein
MKHHRIIVLRRKAISRASHSTKRFVGGSLLIKAARKPTGPIEQQKQNSIIKVEPSKRTLKLKL